MDKGDCHVYFVHGMTLSAERVTMCFGKERILGVFA